MNKKEFLAALQARLGILHEDEIKDILEEYGGYIDSKIAEGKSEEEAVQDFGSLDDLVDEILDAYKINKSYSKQNSRKMKSGIDEFINTLSDIINQVVEYATTFFTNLIEENSAQKLVRILVLILITLIMVSLMRIPFYVIQAIGEAFLRMLLPYSATRYAVFAWEILLNIFYLLIAVLVVMGFVKGEFDSTSISNQIRSLFQTPLPKSKKQKRRTPSYSTTSDTIIVEADVPASEENHEKQELNPSEEYEEDSIYTEEDPADYHTAKSTMQQDSDARHSFGKSLSYLVISLLKFFTFILLLPVYGIIVALAIAVGILIYLFFQGISVFGLFILVIGCLSFISLFINAVWYLFNSNRRFHGYHLKAQLITSCIMIGFGGIFTFYDFMKLEYLEPSAVYEEIGNQENLYFDLEDQPITFHVNWYYDVLADSSLPSGRMKVQVNYFEETTNYSYRDQNQEQYIYLDQKPRSYSPYRNSVAIWLEGLRNNKVYALSSNLSSNITFYINPSDNSKIDISKHGLVTYTPQPAE